MVAFASLIVILAAVPSMLAAPISFDRTTGAHKRAACNARSPSSSVHPNTTSTSTHHSTSTTHHATSTATSNSVKATESSSVKVSSNALALVWPLSVSNAKETWSTSTLVSEHVALNDASLNIYSGKSSVHTYDNAPDGSPAMRAFYEKGSIAPGSSSGSLTPGFDIYAQTGIDLSKGTEILFSYKAYFQEGFEFNKGGKMPGMYGGISDAVAKTCSGGNHGENQCWSSRMMFRTNGAGELYAYFPSLGKNDAELKAVKPKTIINDTYGTSVGRGSFTWATGAWTSISQRIKLNDVGQENGEFQVWVNGECVMNMSGLQFRTDASSLVRGLQLETFFGGHDSTWASPQDQYCWFKDFSTAILA